MNSSAIPDDVKAALRGALERASILNSVTRQAGVMREAFDALLEPKPDAAAE